MAFFLDAKLQKQIADRTAFRQLNLGKFLNLAGIEKSAEKNPELDFLLHGPKSELQPLVAKKKILEGRVEIRDWDRLHAIADECCGGQLMS